MKRATNGRCCPPIPGSPLLTALLPALLLLLLGLALLFPRPAGAFPRLGLELGSFWQESDDGSFDLVGEEDDWRRLGAALGFALTPRLGFWLGYRYGGVDAPLLGMNGTSAELTVHEGEASLTYAVELWSWLHPFARLGGGLVAGRLDLDLAGGEERQGWAFAPSYFVSGGLLVTPGFVRGLQIRESGLFSESTLGVRLEFGYTEVGELLFDQLAASARQPAIRRPDIDLGGLVISGYTWKIALVALF